MPFPEWCPPAGPSPAFTFPSALSFSVVPQCYREMIIFRSLLSMAVRVELQSKGKAGALPVIAPIFFFFFEMISYNPG